MRCPRCGHVEDVAGRYCPECWLEVNPTTAGPDPRIALLRVRWEREHNDRVVAYHDWQRENPEAPPPGEVAPIREPVPPAPSVPVRPWQPLSGRLQAVIVVFVGMAAYELLVIMSDLFERSLAGRIAAGDFTVAEIDASDRRQSLVGIGELVLIIPAAVVWIRWFARAYDNAAAVAGPQRYGSGWAVGGWFVPVLNLWRPKQIANDIWRAIGREPGLLLVGWWTAWIVTSALGRAILNKDVSSPGDLQAVDTLDIVASVIWIAGALLAVRVATTATAGLEARRTV